MVASSRRVEPGADGRRRLGDRRAGGGRGQAGVRRAEGSVVTVGVDGDAARADAPRSALPLAHLCDLGIEFLNEAYSPELALFPYSSRRSADGGWANDYANPAAVRYTINALLGLQAAATAGRGPEPARFDALVDAFVERRGTSLDEPADRGLLLLLLVNGLDRHRVLAEELVAQIDRDARETPLGKLNMQDLGWMIWGSARASRSGVPGASVAAERLFQSVLRHFVDARTGLPRHSVRSYRRDLVSFGSVVYFLRALHEYGAATGDPQAGSLFRGGVERVLGSQGPEGEWPWLLDARRGRIVDPYPIFTVHQDSMAPLFLLPAFDEHGIDGAKDAVTRGLAWVAGRNELGVPMIVEQPFCAYRSIERSEHAPRLRRYLRAVRPALGSRPPEFQSGTVRLNPECRSYHVGWLLYVWSGRGDWSGGGG